MRFSRLIRGVLIPLAALTILVSSAVPASASSATTTVTKVAKPIVKTLSISW
jgi:hypothetical protein